MHACMRTHVSIHPSNPLYGTQNFDLQKKFPAGQELYGAAFQYHMYGTGMGTAVLESSTDGTDFTTLWSKSGEQGNIWKQATVYASSGQTMLRFRYTSGDGETGDFALDNIRVGDCLLVGCAASPNLPCIEPHGTCDNSTGKCSVKPDGTPCEPETTTEFIRYHKAHRLSIDKHFMAISGAQNTATAFQANARKVIKRSARARARAHVCVCTRVHVHACACVHACTRARMCVCVRAYF